MGLELNIHNPNHDALTDDGDFNGAVQLEITRGRVKHRWRNVSRKAFLLGSADDCDMVLGDERFGSVHAYVLRSNDGVSIRWLGEGPELTVNGTPARVSYPLSDGDVIRTGAFEFVIHIHQEAPQLDESCGGPHFSMSAMRLPIGRREISTTK